MIFSCLVKSMARDSEISRPASGAHDVDDRQSQTLDLMRHVRALEGLSSRARGERVMSALAEMGIRPEVQQCRVPGVKNIIVDFPLGLQAKRVLFSAHYDVVKGSPGANDDASGVAVLLGLCGELKELSAPVRIVFFDREESWFRTRVLRLGLLGSLTYVSRNSLRGIAAMYSVEFCGQGDVLVIWPVKGEQVHLGAVRLAREAASRLGLPCRIWHAPWFLLSSDHLSFRLRGLRDAVSLSLLPSGQMQAYQSLAEGLRSVHLLGGSRPVLPEPLSRIHGPGDTSSGVDEVSLQKMLSLLLELIRGW